jgi:hypothetical protein
MDEKVVVSIVKSEGLVELGLIPDKSEIIQPVTTVACIVDYIIGLVALGTIVWLVINRKNKTSLYHGVLWSLLLSVWVLLGLIYTLGPWHDLRTSVFRFIGYILAAPFYLLTQVLGGDTHYLVIFIVTVFTGFCLGLTLGFLRRR